MISFKSRHFKRDMILLSVSWYLAYSLSYRDLEEIMKERGFEVVRMIKKGQLRKTRGEIKSVTEQFHALAA